MPQGSGGIGKHLSPLVEPSWAGLPRVSAEGMDVVHFDGLIDGLLENRFILTPLDPCGSLPVCKILWNGKESIGAPVEGTPPHGLNVETIIVPMGGIRFVILDIRNHLAPQRISCSGPERSSLKVIRSPLEQSDLQAISGTWIDSIFGDS